MKDLINDKISGIVRSYEVDILYACESGSRAWGFPSPNSDYDVRFIYVHNLDWHLSLLDKKDVIDIPINDALDIGGWEIRKVLRLLRKSNPPLLEWIQSPIVYQSNSEFLKEIRSLSQEFFSPIAVMHHYLSMSKKYFEICQEKRDVKLKQYFYALRTAMAGRWIKQKGTVPPIDIHSMFEVVPEEIISRIVELSEIKAKQSENYLHSRDPVIEDFLSITIQENEALADDLPAAKGNIERLDNFYRKVVKGKYL